MRDYKYRINCMSYLSRAMEQGPRKRKLETDFQMSGLDFYFIFLIFFIPIMGNMP